MPPTIDATLKHFNRQAEEQAAQNLAVRIGCAYASLDDYPFNLDVLVLVPLATVQEKLYAAYIRSASKVRIAVVHAEDAALQEEIKALGEAWKKEIELTVVSPTSMNFLIASYLRLLQEKKDSETAQAV